MKTSMVIIGACLLLFTVATADELEKKQSLNCLSSEVTNCLTNFQGGSDAACSSACRSALTDYYEDCLDGIGLDTFNQGYETLCGDAATVGATLFTTISAVLVAVATALN